MRSNWCVTVVCGWLVIWARVVEAKLNVEVVANSSRRAIALTHILKGVATSSVAILVTDQSKMHDLNEFVHEMYSVEIKLSVFTDLERYFDYVGGRLQRSCETASLLLENPDGIVNEIAQRNLAHRLNLFIFYWEISAFRAFDYDMKMPFRAVIVTNPRADVYRIYYNQASPDGKGLFRFVNWYDGNDLGMHKEPLLPKSATVYKDFRRRVISVPVIHSPPWFFVRYDNDNDNDSNDSETPTDNYGSSAFHVYGGRDHNLLQVLAEEMNFIIEYVDPPERTQGSMTGSPDNMTFTGGLGMLQRREADLILGDMAISLDRREYFEFSFFTLADHFSFVTHSPKPLSEALILVRPFHFNVWPVLLVTIILSGPAMYFLISMPFWWRKQPTWLNTNAIYPFFHQLYIDEMRYNMKPRRIKCRSPVESSAAPKNLFANCIWFTINLYLKQNVTIPYDGYRARFVAILLWFSTTYILSDVYLAQLTSQLARPAREGPINTLYKLEKAMRDKKYELFVERQSASLAILENGTGIFARLNCKMKQQVSTRHGVAHNESYLVRSIEEGVRMILDKSPKAILGGRETLFFNIKKLGATSFQLSEKLYTRYSAVAVQNGCLFLQRLNNVLIRLFEGGILDRMTSVEYENMFEMSARNSSGHDKKSLNHDTAELTLKNDPSLGKINFQMLRGVFYVLMFGHFTATIVFLIEFNVRKLRNLARISTKLLATYTRK